MRRIFVFVLSGAALTAACSAGGSKPSLATATSTTVAASTATVVVGDTTFAFAMTCYAPGAGAVVAVGSGTDPVSGKATRALVQAFFRDPYVGVTVGDRDVVYEPTLAEPIELAFQDDVVRGTAIQFVKNLDLQARAGEPAGVGSVVVTCHGYRTGLPPGYGK